MTAGSLVDQTAAQLLDRVIGGEFTTDRPLPAQGQLATLLGVSRLTAREAVNLLAKSGILRVEHGNGTFVNPTELWTDINAIARTSGEDDQGARALLEVRRMIELGAAELCARHLDDRTLDELDHHIVGMEQASGTGDVAAFVRHDIAFHDAILRGTQNRFVAAVYDPMRQALQRGRTQTSRYPEIQQHAIQHHRAVRDALATRDPDKARAAMSDHMDQTLNDLEARLKS